MNWVHVRYRKDSMLELIKRAFGSSAILGSESSTVAGVSNLCAKAGLGRFATRPCGSMQEAFKLWNLRHLVWFDIGIIALETRIGLSDGKQTVAVGTLKNCAYTLGMF